MSILTEAVDFYWRPGCGFCAMLDRRLSQAGIPMNKLNIWDDPGHAEVVRSVARGNETVPTVIVGATALVNPSFGQVIRALETEAPHLVPEDTGGSGPIGRLAQRLLGS